MNESLGKTYSDLMALLPEAAELRVAWSVDEDGYPQAIERIVVIGHDGSTLADALVDDLEAAAPRVRTDRGALTERLAAAAMVLEWAGPFAFEDGQDGLAALRLPSPSHVPDKLPEGWTEQ